MTWGVALEGPKVRSGRRGERGFKVTRVADESEESTCRPLKEGAADLLKRKSKAQIFRIQDLHRSRDITAFILEFTEYCRK